MGVMWRRCEGPDGWLFSFFPFLGAVEHIDLDCVFFLLRHTLYQ
jgi:hypothetical protein